jgi:hypothetical protein
MVIHFFYQDYTDSVADIKEAVPNSADNEPRQDGGSFAVLEVQVSLSGSHFV